MLGSIIILTADQRETIPVMAFCFFYNYPVELPSKFALDRNLNG